MLRAIGNMHIRSRPMIYASYQPNTLLVVLGHLLRICGGGLTQKQGNTAEAVLVVWCHIHTATQSSSEALGATAMHLWNRIVQGQCGIVEAVQASTDEWINATIGKKTP